MNILNKKSRGFTLVEILIVLVILAGIVAMLTKGTMGGRNAALVNQTKIDMTGRIKTAIISKASLLGKVPDSTTDLTATALGLGDINDAFGKAYEFAVSGKTVTIEVDKSSGAANLVNPVVVDLAPYIP
ncbi:MAG: type II secretion system GspH family protein [Puniceicoccales bacterium]|jgi:prepilin-type N-terminal cleavage/methylation domain-containing protein|nr:type II secretion system GspH family protein [Puniceicoccales bacterium]